MAQASKTNGMRKRQAIDKASQTMLLWVMAASVTVSFLLVGAQFFYGQFAYNNRVLGAKNEAVATLEQNLENVEELKKNFGPIEAGTNPYVSPDSILSALPNERDTSVFGTSLQQVFATRSGVQLNSVEIGGNGDESLEDSSSESAADPTPQEIGATVVVTGSYEQVASFIRDLERSIRPIRIDSLDLSGTDTSIRATLEITTYYQPTKRVVIVEEELPR